MADPGDLASTRLGEGPRDPEELEAGAEVASPAIGAGTHPGEVRLSVADLGRSVRYYTESIGLRLLSQSGSEARLGAGDEPLVVLVEEPGARPAAGYAGLYHFALLVPERRDLARWLAHGARDRIGLAGAADHFVSEALYLSDPDEHGIEIYWDRPRSHWEGQVAKRLTTLPLDVQGLIGELDDPRQDVFDGLPEATVMGHVHLRVSAIPETIHFYRDVLGFELMGSLGPRAAFLSAGGYHHHIGANTWESAGAAAAPAGTARLLHATFVVPDEAERDRLLGHVEEAGQARFSIDGIPAVSDPSGNAIRLTAGS